jgi:DNA protecting protein DprA
MELIGNIPKAPRVAVVGSRATQRRFVVAVAAIVRGCREAGFSVVSGGALGIDTAAHEASVRLGVATLAVLPLGRDRPYPIANEALFRRMEATSTPQHGVLFYQASGTTPTRGMFASRNRHVIELCSHVIVVAAGLRSGSVQTGRLGLKRGREVAVVTGTPGAGQLAGAGAICLGAPDSEALELYTARWLSGSRATSAERAWPEHLWFVRDHLRAAGGGGISAIDFGDPGKALGALFEAELSGYLIEVASGVYSAPRLPPGSS